MDTKLKKFSGAVSRVSPYVGKSLYVFTLILAIVTATIVVLAFSIFMAIDEMNWVQNLSAEDYYYAGTITDINKYNWLFEMSGWTCIWGGLLFILQLVAIIAMAGQFDKNLSGSIRLNWFNKIWSELHIVGAIMAIALIYPLLEGIISCWMTGMHLQVWQWTHYYEVETRGDDMLLALMIIGVVACALVALACFVSIVKKLKAGEFWEKSLLGGSFLLILRSIKSSNHTLIKCMVLFITASLLCATWLGLPIVILLIVIFVPKLVKQFNDIKEGVEEVKNGNLSYKIPVCLDSRGVGGEFSRLAAGINEISEASSIAIQNELKSQRLKTELISNVSHDLKTPLTSMVSYIDLLKKEGLDSANASEYLDIIDSKTQRLKSLTENLFEAAKASSGAIPVHMDAIDLSALLTQTLVEMEEKLAMRGLVVQVKSECENLRVKADGQLLWRVLENLLGNVSKYALENSRVYIDLSEHSVGENNLIKIEVKNISKEELNISADELMERFKRGDESRNTEGSGLGLAIAKDLIKMMNGVFELKVDGDLFKATVMLEKA